MSKSQVNIAEIRGIIDDVHRLRSDLESWDTSGLRLVFSFDKNDCISLVALGPPDPDGVAIVTSGEDFTAIMRGYALLARAGSLLLRATPCIRQKKYIELIKRHPPNGSAWVAYLVYKVPVSLSAKSHGNNSGWHDDPANISIEAVDFLLADLNGQLAADKTAHTFDREPEPPEQTGKENRSATVNERMSGEMTKNPEALGWNSTQWAKHLKCAKSTVVETEAWKHLRMAGQRAGAERMKDRRRKPKGSDSQRD